MTSGNKSPTQRLQECIAERAEIQSRLDMHEGVLEELETTREELARVKLLLQQKAVNEPADLPERRRLQELLREAESGRDSYTRRAIAAESKVKQQAAAFNEIHTLLTDKECILPQIRGLLKQSGNEPAELPEPVDLPERQRLQELLREAEARATSWTQRAVSAEAMLRTQVAILNDIRALLAGKECILPQIKALLSSL